MTNNTTFNVGDRVRITDIGIYMIAALSDGGAGLKKRGIYAGNTGTVTATGTTDDGGSNWVSVRTDNTANAELSHDTSGRGGWSFYAEELEKVEG